MNKILFECVNCQRHEVIANGQDGNTCHCGGYLNPLTTTSLPLTLNHRDKPQPTKGDVSIDHSVLCGRDQLKKRASQRKKEIENKPLLTIELQDESSVPKVIYRGEELSYKQHIYFNWETANKESSQSGLELLIKRVVDSEGSPFSKTIKVRSGDRFWSDNQ